MMSAKTSGVFGKSQTVDVGDASIFLSKNLPTA